ncbi:hypothetical protein Q0F98_27275 [Paenibacillus amylolyticus]|nr:hypothetical protein Q0F98_27275 [Paenibacillus amylolyticus]
MVDLVPTLTRAAGLQANPMLPGVDLLGDLRHRGTFCEFHGKGVTAPHSAPAYMWRTTEWKLILYLEGSVAESASRVHETKGNCITSRLTLMSGRTCMMRISML